MSQGTIDVSGVISGPGRMRYGSQGSTLATPFGTVILRGNNTYSGRTIMSRGNVVLAHNNALGTADVKQEGPSQGSLQTGYNFLSDNDSRTIANNMIIAQWQTIKGTNSLTWNGIVYQDNARGMINLLPAGKTLTLGGGQFPNHLEENPPVPGRNLTYDGTGRTVITGGLHDEWSTESQTMNSGTFVGNISFPRHRHGGCERRYQYVLQAARSSRAPTSTLRRTRTLEIRRRWHRPPVADRCRCRRGQQRPRSWACLNSSSNPANDAAVNPVVWDRGGLMLGTGEYGMNLNFTSGPLANAADMSLAAHESGSTYTGTITPAFSTYRLGGGSGALTLPNANQLTGANSVVATNGGEVRITGSNNYTGATRIIAKYQTSLIDAAVADTINFTDDDDIPNDQELRWYDSHGNDSGQRRIAEQHRQLVECGQQPDHPGLDAEVCGRSGQHRPAVYDWLRRRGNRCLGQRCGQFHQYWCAGGRHCGTADG